MYVVKKTGVGDSLGTRVVIANNNSWSMDKSLCNVCSCLLLSGQIARHKQCGSEVAGLSKKTSNAK